MREVEIIASEDGSHFLMIGMDDNEIFSFAMQLYIEKFGDRAIDWCQTIGASFITFMGGDLWIQNSDTANKKGK